VVPLCAELVEHVLASPGEDKDPRPLLAAPQSPAAGAAATPSSSLDGRIVLQPRVCVPNDAPPGLRVLPLMRRVRAARTVAAAAARVSGEDEDALLRSQGLFGRLAALLYLRVLRALPALSRSWWMSLDRAASATVARLTAAHFSPLLVRDELAAVVAHAADNTEEFELRASAAAAEVTARYTKGEIRLSLVVRLPDNYPLQAAAVELADKSGVAEARARRWQLTTSSFLAAQNGSIREAVQLWRRNADKHFEGVEPCPICYSIVEPTTQTLPRMSCSVCRNKFHSVCLYQWFNSSGSSKCPLCRSLF
jgi:hypothetical protein